MIINHLLLNSSIFILVTIAIQYVLTFVFAREALTTQEGSICRVKCLFAVAMYGSMASLLLWFALIRPF